MDTPHLPTNLEQNLEAQKLLNALLSLALENVSLDVQLERALDIILSVSWLPLQAKGGIFLTEGDSRTLALKVQHNLAPDLLRICALVPFGKCLCGRAAASGELQFADCVDDRHDHHYEGMTGHGHYNIPIKLGDEILGVIVLYLDEGHIQKEHEILFLEAVARTMANIIRHKRTEEALQQARRLLEEQVQEQTAELYTLKLAIENSTDAIFLTELDGTITYVNPAFKKLYGYSREEAIGQTPRLLNSGQLPRKKYTKMWRTLLAGQPFSLEITNKAKTGTLIPVESRNAPIKDEQGNIIGFVAIQRDLTRRKKAEAEREKLLAETKQYAHKISILQNITAAVNTTSNLLESLPALVEHMRSFLPVDLLTLSIYTPGEAEFTLYAVGTETEAGHFAPRGTRLPVEGTCPGWAITHDEAWLDDDMRENITFLEDKQLISEGVVSRLVIPLRLGGQVIGTLNLASKQAAAFIQEDLSFLWQIADQLASALERSRFFDEIQRRARREQTIRQITEKLRTATSLDELARLTTEQLSEHLAADYTLLELGIEGGEQPTNGNTN